MSKNIFNIHGVTSVFTSMLYTQKHANEKLFKISTNYLI